MVEVGTWTTYAYEFEAVFTGAIHGNGAGLGTELAEVTNGGRDISGGGRADGWEGGFLGWAL